MINIKQILSPKTAKIYAVLSPFIFFTFTGLAVYLSPWFKWTENWISELAGSIGATPVWSANGLSSLLFNYGLIFTGLFAILFVLTIRKCCIFKDRLGKVGFLVLLIDMIALFGIGIFPVTLGDVHYYLSIVFFGLIPFIILLLGYEIGKMFGKKWYFIISIICGVSMCSVGAFLYLPDLSIYSRAISELIAFCSIAVLFEIIVLEISPKHHIFKNISYGSSRLKRTN